ncbi:MAG: hypothetical protein ACXVLX_19405 [Ilumatobacteraceae bacterium]
MAAAAPWLIDLAHLSIQVVAGWADETPYARAGETPSATCRDGRTEADAVTGWVKRWFVLSWSVGMLFMAIGIFFQNRDGKPSGSMPWAPLFIAAWVSMVTAMFFARRRNPDLFGRNRRHE